MQRPRIIKGLRYTRYPNSIPMKQTHFVILNIFLYRTRNQDLKKTLGKSRRIVIYLDKNKGKAKEVGQSIFLIEGVMIQEGAVTERKFALYA